MAATAVSFGLQVMVNEVVLLGRTLHMISYCTLLIHPACLQLCIATFSPNSWSISGGKSFSSGCLVMFAWYSNFDADC